MIVSVLVEIKFKQKEKTFDYNVPSILEKEIQIGKRVLVPFGNQKLEGFIINVKKESNYELKNIIEVLDKEPILNKELLNLGKELSDELVSNLISVYQSMLPKAYKAKRKSNINIKTDKYIKLISIDKAKDFLKNSKAKKQKQYFLYTFEYPHLYILIIKELIVENLLL